MRLWLFLVYGCVAVLLAGCGGSSEPAPVATHTHSQPTPPPQPIASALTGPPAFTLHATSSEGDQITVEGRFGTAELPSEAEPGKTAFENCPHADGRELVVPLDLTTTITTDLAADVELNGFRSNVTAGNLSTFLMMFSNGPDCQFEGNPEQSVKLEKVVPHEKRQFVTWVILDDAITPRELSPSPKVLGAGWSMAIPRIGLNGSSSNLKVAAWGPHIIQCEAEPFIYITGTPPTGASIGTEGEQAPCGVQAYPMTVAP